MASKSARGAWRDQKKKTPFLRLHWKGIELKNPALRRPEKVGLRLLLYTHYARVWTSAWKRNLLGVIKHTEVTCSSGSLLNWKHLGESMENILYMLVLFTTFPRDPVGTQNIGLGGPMAAVNRAFSVICLFTRHTVCSITISMICFRNSKLPACEFFSQCEEIFLL